MSKTLTMFVIALCMLAHVARGGTFRRGPEGAAVEGRYIVVFHPHAARLGLEARRDLPTVASVARRLSQQYNFSVARVWDRALRGMVINTDEGTAKRLAAHPLIESVEQDFSVDLTDLYSSSVGSCYFDSYLKFGTIFYRTPPSSNPQSINCTDSDPTHDTGGSSQPALCEDNWGLDRIDQRGFTRDGLYSFDRTGSVPGQVNVRVFIMDVGGLNVAHRDFLNAQGTASRASAIDFSGDTSCAPTTDPLGHATHVAAIAAGRIFGVAKDATITMLRISNCAGSGFPSWAVDALNTAAGQRPGVVNWSGGNDQTWIGTSALRAAVRGVVNSGVMVVQAAGNQSYPYWPYSWATITDACTVTFGNLPGVLVVGGVDQNNSRWTRHISGDLVNSFCPADCGSNVGPCIDLWAPAANILSAGRYDSYGYCRLSGTSMAAPHATGVAALYLQAHPSALPAEVESALVASATTGVLNRNTSTANHIGSTSPDRLLYSRVP